MSLSAYFGFTAVNRSAVITSKASFHSGLGTFYLNVMFCTAVEYIPRERACEQRVSRFQTSNSSDDTLRSSRLQKCSFNSGELTTSTYTSYISRSVLSTSTPHIATHQSGSMMIKKSNSVSPPLNPFGRTLNNDFFLKKILRCKKPGPAWKSWSMMAWSKILD